MLCDVKAFGFFLCINPDSECDLEDQEENQRSDECEHRNAKRSDKLCHETATSKDTYRKSSEDTADTVDGNRTDWIVDLDLIEEQHRADYKGTGDKADND